MTRPSRATATSARRSAETFRCEECGAGSIRWVGRCPECQAWGSMSQAAAVAPAQVAGRPVRTPARPIGAHGADIAAAVPTGVAELDRVLGGGLVAGSVVLLAGEPGVGKSTLLLEVARSFACEGGRRALVITGEESTAQVRLRAERTGALADDLYLAAENDLGAVVTHVETLDPGLLVVDSVQTLTCDGVDNGAGSVTQIRAVAGALIALAKARGMATVLVGHVTKDGSIAGPRTLEHLVDVVLHFEGDRHSSLRLIRAVKNRYGATDEVGCFEMREDGMVGLADPSGLFLSRRGNAVAGTCVTVTVEGRRPLGNEVQSLVNRALGGGSPRRSVTDLDSSRVAMVLAILTKHTRVPLGESDVYAASVGGLRITEPAADLAIALAVHSAALDRPLASTLCGIGELSLSGDVRPVPALSRRLAEAARLGFRTILVPVGSPGADSGRTVGERGTDGRAIPAGLSVVAVGSVSEAIDAAAAAATLPERRLRRI
ncbi:MAG: DNA repair protein RadA [bacterium]